DGITGEYYTDVVHNGKCFANIWERDQTGEYMDAPEAINELNTSMEIGMSSFERYKGFGDKTKSRGSKKKADLYTMDMIPHNTWWATDDPVSKCRVLRVGEKGETSEYIADVVGDRNCFDNVSFVRDSTLFETGDPSEDI
ncbi:hypothetical protein FOZ63_012067, partial [Perkinsus olseni]